VRVLREHLLAQGDLLEVGPLVFEVQLDKHASVGA
jgi:hypothetical protein